MITNQTELAREVGSRAADPKTQRADIQTAVRTHTKGDVSIYLFDKHLDVQANTNPPRERIFYPFTSDEFWKTVEFIQEEGLEWDEDEEDILHSFVSSPMRTAPHEFYD
ncbi:MAG: hypothetical protein ACXABY_02625 [Candidatus Thorarchaeota archaeon]|jgi:hypothetical protein